MKIEIKNRYTGRVMFVHEEEGNTLRKIVERLVKKRVDLELTNLRAADLEGADLRAADLEGADLRGANLRGANLERANLERADLRAADLEGADLEGTIMPLFCKWSYSISDDKILIGCKAKTADEWEEWLASDEVFTTKRNDPSFLQIEAVIRACIAYQRVMLR